MRRLALLSLTACASTSAQTVDEPLDELVCAVPDAPAAEADRAPAGPAVEAVAGDLLIVNARLIDGTGAAPRANVDVLIHSGRIARIATDLQPAAGATTVDVAGRTLLPGFIDAHVHLTFDPPENYAAGVARSVRESDADRALRGVHNARATLMAGFTTVRNVGGSFADRALRDAIIAGLVPGPRMLVANHSIGISGGHCDHTNARRPDLFGGPPDYTQGVADGSDEVRKAVRYQVKHGADVIKICATGGVLSQGDGVGAPQLTVAEMRAIVEEAARAERKVAAHAHGNLGIREAVQAGVHSIEHGSVLDESTIALMKRRGTYLVPTTYVGKVVEDQANAGRLSEDSADKAREIAPKMRKSFALAVKRNVKIALGSDAGVFPHGENAQEFVTMVGLGMSPADAIVAGTASAADLLGVSDVGRVQVGKRADLVVVEGDPLDDIEALESPALVIKGGVIYLGPTWESAPATEHPAKASE